MLSNELVSSFTSIHACLFSPFYKFITYLALFFVGGCISTSFMHLDEDKGQYKSDYLICETQEKNEKTIPSSVSFTLMINKRLAGKGLVG